jgi:hypothetical protein
MSDDATKETPRPYFFLAYARAQHRSPQGNRFFAEMQRGIADLLSMRHVLASEDTTELVFLSCCQTAVTDSDAPSVTHLDSAETTFVAGPLVATASVSVTVPTLASHSPAVIPVMHRPLGRGSQFDFSILCADTTPRLISSGEWCPASRPGSSVGFSAVRPASCAEPSIGPTPTFLTPAAGPPIMGMIKLILGEKLRADLLRLIDGLLAARALQLVRVQAGLARHPDASGFALVLVAASRCYGHRGEPDDHLLPRTRPMSVVRGELALAC